MHLACLHSNEEIVRLLLQHHASPHLENKKKRTPFHLATSQGNKEIVDLLIKSGVDTKSHHRPASPKRSTQSPKNKLAAHKGHLDIVRNLMGGNPWNRKKKKKKKSEKKKPKKNGSVLTVKTNISKFLKKRTASALSIHRRLSAALLSMSPKSRREAKRLKLIMPYVFFVILFSLDENGMERKKRGVAKDFFSLHDANVYVPRI